SAYAAPVIPPLAFGVTVVLASGIPFLIVVFLAIRERRVRRISWSEMLPVTYPLLTNDGQIPGLYRCVASYPTTFVIDRRGILQPAMGGEQSLEKLDKVIVSLFNGRPSSQ
ncbi:MAG TPA: hypothetical protein VJS37_13610, partial [Terriglobales bacterium]|nr:hypothetical protein [Terriglobales bacterium]